MIYTTLVVAVSFSILRRLPWPEKTHRVTPVNIDPEVLDRIRVYMSKSMVERYGAHGPP
jgi:hypothetical protein